MTFIVNAKNIKTGVKIEEVDGVIKVSGTLFFINAGKLTDIIVKALENADTVTVDFDKLENIDQTAFEKLSTIIKKEKAQNKTIEIINSNQKVSARFERFGTVI